MGSSEREISASLNCSQPRIRPESDDDPSCRAGSTSERRLVEGTINVGLEERRDDAAIEGKDGDFGDQQHKSQYPLRPGAPDCNFYVRNGWCKFRYLCRFNHPAIDSTSQEAPQASQLPKRPEQEQDSVEPSKRRECQHDSTAEASTHGEALSHPEERIETVEHPLLNFLGLPIRSGEEECPSYMQDLSCVDGVNCRFHHPDPTTDSAFSLDEVSANGGAAKGKSKYLKTSGAKESKFLSWIESSCQNSASGSSNVPAEETRSSSENRSSYAPGIHPSSQEVPAATSTVPGYDGPPSRPATDRRLVCKNFLKGKCSYGSMCHFYHPEGSGSSSKRRPPRGRPRSDRTS